VDFHSEALRDCQQKNQCTSGDYRWLSVHINSAARQRARDLANEPAYARSQNQRSKVEALFAGVTPAPNADIVLKIQI
jgi:hypothetical protein